MERSIVHCYVKSNDQHMTTLEKKTELNSTSEIEGLD